MRLKRARDLRSLIIRRSSSQSTSTQLANNTPSVRKKSSNRKSIVNASFTTRTACATRSSFLALALLPLPYPYPTPTITRALRGTSLVWWCLRRCFQRGYPLQRCG